MGLLVPLCSLQSLFQVFFSWSFNFQMMRLIAFPLTAYYAFQKFVKDTFVEFFLSKNSLLFLVLSCLNIPLCLPFNILLYSFWFEVLDYCSF